MAIELICIVCPRGCHIKVDGKNISGNSCPRGYEYALKETSHPERVLTTTIRVVSGSCRVCSVRTNKAIPKELVFDAMKIINKTSVKSPVLMNQVLIKNILNTGVDVISSEEIL